MSLTKEELKEKINQVKSDLAKHQSSGNSKMISGLTEYIEYLEDELKLLDKK
jgi:hypothetical protein